MKTFEDKITVLDKASYDGVDFEVIAINNLQGAKDPKMAMNLYFAQQAGLVIRQVRIKLNDGIIKTEAGALYYYKGNIKSETEIGGVGGILKKAIMGSITSESAMKPTYRGTGEILLEPSFKHYLLVKLENESIIVDKAMFYASSGSIDITASSQKNISSAFLGGEGLFQLKLSGSGIVVLELDVPSDEIVQYELRPGEEVKVDGNFCIARSTSVDFSVTTSDKNLVATAMNGEGLLNTFKLANNEQKGFVWLAPTAPIYRKLQFGMPITNAGSNHIQ